MSNHHHLCDAFIERTRRRPDDPFAILLARGEARVLTNGWVLNRALSIGERLREQGVMAGDLVAIVLEHGAELYPSFLGCMIFGCVPTFLPPLTHKQDKVVFRRSMAALFARTAPAAIIASRGSLEHVPDDGASVLTVEDVPEAIPDDGFTRLRDRPGTSLRDAAFLQHSSGTTGLKKGVMLSHAAAMEQIGRYAESIAISPTDVVASWLPLYHDMGLITGFLLPLLFGNVVVRIDAVEWVARPTMLLDAIENYRAAFAWLPNFAFHHLLRAAGDKRRWDLGWLKAIIDCSEPCRVDTFDQFAGRFAAMGVDRAKLRVCYALAENVFAVTQTPADEIARHGESDATRGFLSCGRPIAGAEIEIRDHNGESIPAGSVGEIHIRSTTLFLGYFREPERTAERLRDGWFSTRDIGCVEGAELFVLGRVDDLLIVNGKNLFAHEIENVLTAVAGIVPGRALACTDYDSSLGASRLLILCEVAADLPDTSAVDREIRKTVLAESGVFPASVHFLPRGFLLKSSSGKLARAASIDKFKRDGRG